MRIDPQLAATSLEAQRARIAAARTDANAAGAAEVSGNPTSVSRTGTTDPMEAARAARRAAAVAPSTAPAEAAPTAPPSFSQEITVDDILKNWGTNNANADLNGDGGVDAQDLALLLSWQGGETGEVAPDLSTGAPSTGGPQFTLEGLLSDWGQSESMYDFDGDGTVGSGDLAQFLSGGVDGPTGPPSFAPPAGDGDRVAQLMAAWGSDDAQFDLNGDGTVDAADLATLLAGGGAPGETPSTAPSDGAAPPAGADAVSDLVDGLAKQIIAASGGTDGLINAKEFAGNPSIFKIVDQDQDGVISGQDLQGAITHSLKSVMMQGADVDASAFSQRWLDAFGVNDRMAGPSGPEDMARPLPKVTDGGMDTTKLDRLVGAIERRLERAGFSSQPPTNLHQILNNLNLNSEQQQYVLRHLGDSYPQGLGLNRMA